MMHQLDDLEEKENQITFLFDDKSLYLQNFYQLSYEYLS